MGMLQAFAARLHHAVVELEHTLEAGDSEQRDQYAIKGRPMLHDPYLHDLAEQFDSSLVVFHALSDACKLAHVLLHRWMQLGFIVLAHVT